MACMLSMMALRMIHLLIMATMVTTTAIYHQGDGDIGGVENRTRSPRPAEQQPCAEEAPQQQLPIVIMAVSTDDNRTAYTGPSPGHPPHRNPDDPVTPFDGPVTPFSPDSGDLVTWPDPSAASADTAIPLPDTAQLTLSDREKALLTMLTEVLVVMHPDSAEAAKRAAAQRVAAGGELLPPPAVMEQAMAIVEQAWDEAAGRLAARVAAGPPFQNTNPES